MHIRGLFRTFFDKLMDHIISYFDLKKSGVANPW